MTDAVNTVKVKVNTATLDNSDQLELDSNLTEEGKIAYVTIGSYDTENENGDTITNGVKVAAENKILELENKHTEDITNLQTQIFKLDSNVVHKYGEYANDLTFFDESIYGGKNFYGTTTFNNYITITNAGHLTVDSNAHFSKVPTTITPTDNADIKSIPNIEWVNKLVKNGDTSTETKLQDYISGEISKLRLDDVVHKSGQETIDGDKEFLTIPKTVTPPDGSNDNSIPNTEWVNNKITTINNDFHNRFDLNYEATIDCKGYVDDLNSYTALPKQTFVALFNGWFRINFSFYGSKISNCTCLLREKILSKEGEKYETLWQAQEKSDQGYNVNNIDLIPAQKGKIYAISETRSGVISSFELIPFKINQYDETSKLFN